MQLKGMRHVAPPPRVSKEEPRRGRATLKPRIKRILFPPNLHSLVAKSMIVCVENKAQSSYGNPKGCDSGRLNGVRAVLVFSSVKQLVALLIVIAFAGLWNHNYLECCFQADSGGCCDRRKQGFTPTVSASKFLQV